MKIGELSRITGTQVETIRYYEREGLLPEISRTASNYRIYGNEHAERLSFIRNCRNLDMTLDEVRALLRLKEAPSGNCTEVNAVLNEHIWHVTSRISELQQLKHQLENLCALCEQERGAVPCGILGGLSQKMVTSGKSSGLPTDHVHGTHGGGQQSEECKCNANK